MPSIVTTCGFDLNGIISDCRYLLTKNLLIPSLVIIQALFLSNLSNQYAETVAILSVTVTSCCIPVKTTIAQYERLRQRDRQ